MEYAGDSLIEVENVRGKSRLVSAKSIKPLKILNPDCESASHIVLAGYGGGMLAGDYVGISIKAGAGTKSFLTTQSNSRYFKSENGKSATQILKGKLTSDALFVNFPDPLIPHRDSHIKQIQDWNLEGESMLLSIDWFTSGRSEGGEQFEYISFESQMEVHVSDELVLKDKFSFSPNESNARSQAVFGKYNHFLSGYLISGAESSKYQDLRLFLKELCHVSESALENYSLGNEKVIYACDEVKPGVLVFRLLGDRRLDLEKYTRAISEKLSSPEFLGFDFVKRRF